MPLDPSLFHVGRDDLNRIKRRSAQLIKQAGGPDVFQHVAGVPKDMLSKYCSASEPNIMRLDVAVALDRELKAPMMIAFAAEMLGYRLVPIEATPDDGEAVTFTDLTDLHKPDGNVEAELAQALEDGVIDLEERRRTRNAIAKKQARLMRLDRKLARNGGAA